MTMTRREYLKQVAGVTAGVALTGRRSLAAMVAVVQRILRGKGR